MVSQEVMEQIMTVLAELRVPVLVIDRDRDAVVSDPDHLVIRTSPLLREDGPCVIQGKLCIHVERPDVVLVCEKNLQGAREILRLSAALITQMQTRNRMTDHEPDALRHLLLGDLASGEIDMLCSKLHMVRNMDRRVLIFHILQMESDRTYALMKDITPMEDTDLLVDLDRHTAVMIKDIRNGETLDDALQYARALQETVMGETARTMTVGIGNSVTDMGGIPESYKEARRAIEVGRIFAPESYVYAYSQLLLERFLMELPENTARNYLHVLFNERTQRVLNEEMLYTVETFFKKDLNLSDTARQLYIHRNTLVYRLDKLYRYTGLDLRKFEDAMTFKIFLELRKSRRKQDDGNEQMRR